MVSRVYIVIKGAVQGVGFRPFIYNLAVKMNLRGYVLNSSSGVYIEAEQEKKYLDEFIMMIEKDKPPRAVITGLEFSFLDPVGYEKFEINESRNDNDISALVMPDIATCDDCNNELFNPADRRYRYPFINCTNCGPRFSIIDSLPYDRPNTSMKNFEMCDKCREEYENPLNRRFHAQPVACPDCGPRIELWDPVGNIIASKDEALILTAAKIKQGEIIALKGLGGFQLIADASNEETVKLLRERKHREEKPFALMFPDIELVKQICKVSVFEERLLKSPESPIVLLKRKNNRDYNHIVSNSVAPGNPYLGIMLPYTPLHLLLTAELKNPVIATSGNISEEPICIGNSEALEKLRGMADYYLVHNRTITRHVDDSITKVVMDKEMILRRARGYAPFPIRMSVKNTEEVILAVGGHLKNTVALRIKENIFISQHIGDLSTGEAFNTFSKVIEDLEELYKVKPNIITADRHPDYLSSKYAKSTSLQLAEVQHHFAHVASCMCENQISGKVLGVSWDGTGLGLDNSVWGGEFFLSDESHYSHFAQLRQFYLPGADTAVKEPRRSALGLLYSMYGNKVFEGGYEFIESTFSKTEFDTLKHMLNKKLNTVLTSSAGRLFDAAASLLNIGHYNNYEGQAAMNLEFSASASIDEYYHYDIEEGNIYTVDWRPFIDGIIKDRLNNVPVEIIAGMFHNTLAQIILSAAKKAGLEKIVLSGGCFQNTLLLEKSVKLLQDNGFKAYWHQRIPTNDGGLSAGQVFAAKMSEVPSNFFFKF